MAVAPEAFEETVHLGVQHGMLGDFMGEFPELGLCRQFAIEKEVADFQESRIRGELLNRITAVQQDTFLTVNKCNLRFARASRCEARIECEYISFGVKSFDVDDIWSFNAA
ncbi:MAG: Uncharacterised protein [Hyphomonas sp. TMED17]|nr:MAG: Uncharacterised protein [Hyphomonas sp. TMED17]